MDFTRNFYRNHRNAVTHGDGSDGSRPGRLPQLGLTAFAYWPLAFGAGLPIHDASAIIV